MNTEAIKQTIARSVFYLFIVTGLVILIITSLNSYLEPARAERERIKKNREEITTTIGCDAPECCTP